MNDYGKPCRSLFLGGQDRERKQKRNVRILLAVTWLYMGAHVAYYLINVLVEAA